LLVFSSCESEAEKIKREAQTEKQRIEVVEKIEKDRIEKEIYDLYINNSLETGSEPYAYCFGKNKTCTNNGCSKIKVKTPYNSDVIVTIKKANEVVRHGFIKANSSFTFEFPNGTYQAFFYYGKGWNPNKEMTTTSCGILKGGFIKDEQISKDSPQVLNNNILEYELILQENGNLQTKPSNSKEAF
jgi:hypothetical protein